MFLKGSKKENDILFRAPEPYPKRHRGAYLMSIFFLLLLGAGYIGFRTSSIYRAPSIYVNEPPDGALLKGDFVRINGTTQPNSRMTINGFETFSDEEGKFGVELPFEKGFNVLDIRARNKIGKEAKVVRHIVVD